MISPFTKRAFLDSTLYTTSSMLRTMELLLGLPPMTQFAAAAGPMYNAFTDKANPAPYVHLKPRIDVNERNLATAWGAKTSMEMDLDEIDRAPMHAFNEIIWKSVKGADSPMPPQSHVSRCLPRVARRPSDSSPCWATSFGFEALCYSFTMLVARLLDEAELCIVQRLLLVVFKQKQPSKPA